jgi:hypothetical protein
MAAGIATGSPVVIRLTPDIIRGRFPLNRQFGRYRELLTLDRFPECFQAVKALDGIEEGNGVAVVIVLHAILEAQDMHHYHVSANGHRIPRDS